MLKRLELDGVAGWVEEEHGGLLARFAFEADVWLDDEGGAGGLQALCQFMPLLHGEHDAEVATGDVVAINFAGFGHGAFVRRKMGDDLVTVKIKVHPVRAGATFLAAEQIKVEAAGGGQVVRGEGEVERLDGHGI